MVAKQGVKKSSCNFFLNYFLLDSQKNRGKIFSVAASEFGEAHVAKKSSSTSFFYVLSFAPSKERTKENLSSVLRLPSFFFSVKRKKQRKPLQRPSSSFFLFLRKKKEAKKTSPAYNITAKNLLERASLDKLLASLVRQYLRSPFSYGFINAVNCNAGFIYSHPPPRSGSSEGSSREIE